MYTSYYLSFFMIEILKYMVDLCNYLFVLF